MKLPRRAVLQLATAAAALPASAWIAGAESYPARPVHMIVDLPPGLAPDVLARLVGPLLSQRLGGEIVVENKPGAGGNIGAEYVAHAAPDGYTLLVMISGNAAGGALYPNLTFNFARDIAAVAFLGYTPFVVAINPSIPVKTIPELIAHAKANPGKLNFASPGAGTAPHLAFELFRMITGVDIVHVPYREANSGLASVIGGATQMMFSIISIAKSQIDGGTARGIGVTSLTPSALVPDLPAIAQSGLPGFEVIGWNGFVAPKATPPRIIAKLNAAILDALATAEVREKLKAAGYDTAATNSPQEFADFIAADTKKWLNLATRININAN